MSTRPKTNEMNISHKLEKLSSVAVRLTITVAAESVDNAFGAAVAEYGKTAKVKGFRPGHVPESTVRQLFMSEIRDKVFHAVVDLATNLAVQDAKLKTVGRPYIQTLEEFQHAVEHAKAEKEGKPHDHSHDDHRPHSHADSVVEGKDFVYIAEVDLWPEISLKKTGGFSFKKLKVYANDSDVEQVIQNVLESRAELVPVLEDRPAEKGDFADFKYEGGVLNQGKVEMLEGLKGQRLIEIGSNSVLPDLEQGLVGARRGVAKTIRLTYPGDYNDPNLAGKEAEFTLTLNEIKTKRLPEVTDELAKELGYENEKELRDLARESVLKNRADMSERKIRSDLLSELIRNNPFEVPTSLVRAQVHSLIDDYARELKERKASDDLIREIIARELDAIRKKAESQVKASLVIEACADLEKITVDASDLEAEYKKWAADFDRPIEEIKKLYAAEDRKAQLEFRLREQKTVTALLAKCNVEEVEAEALRAGADVTT